jgi:phage shock protein E
VIKKINKPVVAVCRSGNRSAIPVNVLKKAGIVAYNGGAWDMLKRKITWQLTKAMQLKN